MKGKRVWWYILMLCGIGFIAGVPLLSPGFIPTHDGEYHIIRIVEFSRMLEAGYFVPRWAPDVNSGYGIPIFEFHYPFPDYVGSFIRFFTRDAVSAFQIGMGIGYLTIILAAFGWLAALFGTLPAFVGAATAAFVPYLFVDMYVRGTIGEIWALAFLFLSLLAVEKKQYVWFALAFALIVLSHNILAMMFAPFLLGYCVIRGRALWGMAAGIGLSAFFWLPALAEQKFVVGLNTVNFRQHFVRVYELLIPSWGTGFSGTADIGNKMSFQIGIAPIIAILGGLGTAKRNKLFIYFFVLFLTSVFMMLPVSGGVWETIKPLQFIQYPWRLLSFLVPFTAYATGYWVSRMKRPWIGAFFALFAMVVAGSYTRPVMYGPRNEAYYLSRPNFIDGTSSMGNSFSTIWTGWKAVRPASSIDVESGKLVGKGTWKYLNKEFTVSMTQSGDVSVNTLYFPGWTAAVNGRVVPIDYQKEGIIRFPVPEGTHVVRVYFTETPVRKAADIMSLVSLAILGAYAILGLYEYCHRHDALGNRPRAAGRRDIYKKLN